MREYKVMTKLKSNKKLWVEIGNYKTIERAIDKLTEQKKNRKTYVSVIFKIIVL